MFQALPQQKNKINYHNHVRWVFVIELTPLLAPGIFHDFQEGQIPQAKFLGILVSQPPGQSSHNLQTPKTWCADANASALYRQSLSKDERELSVVDPISEIPNVWTMKQLQIPFKLEKQPIPLVYIEYSCAKVFSNSLFFFFSMKGVLP